jgi:hypothetical protein
LKRYLLKKGADPAALTTENERPIDLADPNDFPIISMLLNHMKPESQTYEEISEDEDGKDEHNSETSSQKILKQLSSEFQDISLETDNKAAAAIKKKSRFSMSAS